MMIKVSKEWAAKSELVSHDLSVTLNKADTAFVVIGYEFKSIGLSESDIRAKVFSGLICTAKPFQRDGTSAFYDFSCVNGVIERWLNNEKGTPMFEILMVATTPTGSELEKLLRAAPEGRVVMMLPNEVRTK
jgi:hypothetical protein